MLFILTIASLRKDWKRTPLFSIQKKYNYQSLEIDEPIIFEDFLVEVSVISCIFQDLRQGCIMISSYDYYSDLSVDYSTFNSCSNPGKAGSCRGYPDVAYRRRELQCDGRRKGRHARRRAGQRL